MSVEQVIASINNVLWGEGQVLIYVLLFAGFWFSYKLKFVQILNFRHMFSVLKNSGKLDGNSSDSSGISSLQALFIGLSARVGTGNLAGVAVAISLGLSLIHI